MSATRLTPCQVEAMTRKAIKQFLSDVKRGIVLAVEIDRGMNMEDHGHPWLVPRPSGRITYRFTLSVPPRR